MIKVAIIGGTGYTGAELLRVLLAHTLVEVTLITSRAESGRRVSDLFPNLSGHSGLVFSSPEQADFSDCDVVFSATPNGVAMTHARDIVNAGGVLIDLAADFRLRDSAVWEQWYDQPHTEPELLANAVYGLPEVFRSTIKKARIVANPGCYPTATLLGLYPLVKHSLITQKDIIVDAKSGVTGAGRGANTANLFSEVADNFKAYGASGHRHHPEISQYLADFAPQSSTYSLTFIPHLLPILRGIHATMYVDVETSLETVHELYRRTYANEAFVDVLPLGDHPQTRSVRSSNMCRIALHKAAGSNKLVILSVIDNLHKGAAGQAVQNMNLIFGFAETHGLQHLPVLP